MKPIASCSRRSCGASRTLVLALVAGLALPAGAAEPSGTPLEEKVAPGLSAAARSGALDRVLVILAEQADVRGARLLPTKREKGRYVVERLRETAERTQAGLRDAVAARGWTARPYFVWNALLVETAGGRSLGVDDLAFLAERPEVARIEPDRAASLPGTGDFRTVPSAAARGVTVQPNLDTIGATAVHDSGQTGEGMVVGILDSGVDVSHPALADNYRGAGGPHDHHWFDTIGGSTSPIDPNGHGTHVAGIAVGGTHDDRIGVAPGASWIACRGIFSAQTILDCLEFFLAPTDLAGQNADPDLAPDVINHSYMCPFCPLQTVFSNLQEAGVFHAAATGNAGPSCDSVFDPSTYPTATAVGSIVPGGRDAELAESSSRGPNFGNAALRPHLVAPGDDIVSSVPGGGYALSSGTSMATPHVSGSVALLWAERPELHGDVAATRTVLYESAHPRPITLGVPEACSSTTATPNNLYGHGVLDIAKATGVSLFADGFESGDTSRW